MYIAIGSTLPEACVLNKLSVTVTENGKDTSLSAKIVRSNTKCRLAKTTWIAPEDAHKAPGTKYKTLLTDDDFADMPPYTGIKFRPKMEK